MCLTSKDRENWLKAAGFTVDPDDEYFYYWKGYGRHWRINCEGWLQASEPFSTFDRWSNSVQYSKLMPKTKEEFVKLVEFMVKRCERKERLIAYLNKEI